MNVKPLVPHTLCGAVTPPGQPHPLTVGGNTNERLDKYRPLTTGGNISWWFKTEQDFLARARKGSETQGDILLKREWCAHTAPLFFIYYGMADQ